MNFIRQQTEGRPKNFTLGGFYGRAAVGANSAAEKRF